jgi:hypothetical protein
MSDECFGDLTNSLREMALCKVGSYRYDCHDFPFQSKVELMKRFASPSWHFVDVNRKPQGLWLAWDGEVTFIR